MTAPLSEGGERRVRAWEEPTTLVNRRTGTERRVAIRLRESVDGLLDHEDACGAHWMTMEIVLALRHEPVSVEELAEEMKAAFDARNAMTMVEWEEVYLLLAKVAIERMRGKR